MNDEPRIRPGGRADIGLINDLITRALGLATGGAPPNLFTTLARHRGLFRPWLRFAGAMMPGGLLRRVDSELVILRVAHNMDCEYERRHHAQLARVAGLSVEEIDGAAGREADDPRWSPRQRLLLRAADELHAERVLSDPLWTDLSEVFSDAELIELCLLIGHYEMLAATLNSLRVAPDTLPARPPLTTRLITSAMRRAGR